MGTFVLPAGTWWLTLTAVDLNREEPKALALQGTTPGTR
jgi:hypothetical protein